MISVLTDDFRNRKHVPCFYRVIETRVEVGSGRTRNVFPQLFRVPQNVHECFYTGGPSSQCEGLFFVLLC